jgi:hypothetical protein
VNDIDPKWAITSAIQPRVWEAENMLFQALHVAYATAPQTTSDAEEWEEAAENVLEARDHLVHTALLLEAA